MTDELLQKLYRITKSAIDTYGPYNQCMKATEECAELIRAVSRLQNMKDDVQCENVISEIADVYIMMIQMTYMFGTKKVEEMIAYKLDRLEQRISNEQTI